MQPKKPLSDKELAEFEAGQDFEALLVQSARQMAAGKTHKVYTPVIEARQNIGMTQAGFADMMGVSPRTLQQWEQGRREPSGAAKVLVEIARKAPEVFRAIGMNGDDVAARAPKGSATRPSSIAKRPAPPRGARKAAAR